MSYNLVKNIFGSILCTTLAILVGLITFMPINVDTRQVYADNYIESSMRLDSSTESEISSYTTSNIVLPYTNKWTTDEPFDGTNGYIMSNITLIKLYFYKDQGYTYMRILSLGTLRDSFSSTTSNYHVWDIATVVNLNSYQVANWFYFNNQYWTDYRLNDNVLVNRTNNTVSTVVNNGQVMSLTIGSPHQYSVLSGVLFTTTGTADINFFSATLGSRDRPYYGVASEYITYAAAEYSFTMEFLAFDTHAKMLDTRTYVTNIEATDDYDLGYSEGFQRGGEAAVRDNKQAWYNEGFDRGKGAGESIGYNRGLNDANQYTFLNLFGAMIDAPVQAFSGLLDFDVFGIDAKSLVLSLFTLCIVLVIIRLATKGGGN